MLIYYNYLFLENSFTLVFHKCFWYFLTNHLFKKDSRLKDLLRLIWVYFWAHFAGVRLFIEGF